MSLDMEPRQELKKLALDFLKAIAKKATDELGTDKRRIQQSIWTIKTGSTFSSRVFKREIVDHAGILEEYQSKWSHENLFEEQKLKEFLSAHKVPIDERVRYSLLQNWLQLPDPFKFDVPAIANLLDEFANAVSDKIIILKSCYAIEGLIIDSSPILLEEGINIHNIAENELWDFGEIYFCHRTYLDLQYLPDDSWKILEIQRIKQDQPIHRESTLNAILTALRLESSGSFRVIDLGTEFNYFGGFALPGGISSLRMAGGEYRTFRASNQVQMISGRFGTYTLNNDGIQHLQESWPDIHKIMESDTHYLRMPAQRLIEGGFRDRPEDAIIDYAVGLERLLLWGVEDELSYRFALRGATVLGWKMGRAQSFYNNLKEFYNLRSSIVHGSMRRKSRLKLNYEDARSIGEDYLRKIWWWFFENGFKEEDGLARGATEIEVRILRGLGPEESCRGSRYEQEI